MRQEADTNIEGSGCAQCDKLERDLEREHRRYLDASRIADDRRKELVAARARILQLENGYDELRTVCNRLQDDSRLAKAEGAK